MNNKLSRVIEIAKLLQPEKQDGKNFHVTAAIKKRKIIAIAWNTYQEPNLSHVFGEYVPTRGGENYKAGRHSEAQLLKKLKIPTKDLTFVNVRLGKNGEPMMARCCKNCERILRERGFRRIIYSINQNEYGTIN